MFCSMFEEKLLKLLKHSCRKFEMQNLAENRRSSRCGFELCAMFIRTLTFGVTFSREFSCFVSSLRSSSVWNKDLKLEKTIEAHPVNVYDLVASDKYLYSCSNDNTVKVWNIDTLQLVKSIDRNLNTEVLKLFYTNDKLYLGDNVGNILVLENEEIIGQYGIMEEVSGLCAKDNYLFTTGQRDFTVSETKPGSKTQISTKKCESGRGPICLMNDKVFFVNSDARSISVLRANPAFENLQTLHGHDMIINAINGDSVQILYSGGYDKVVKCWDTNTFKNTASIPCDDCIYAIASGDNQVFVSSGDGSIEKFIVI